jgi:phage terminase large subunit-like protein
VVNRTVTQSGDPRLARHVGNCVVRVDSRGTRLAKEHKHSLRKIDLAVASVMAHSRATWLAGRSAVQVFTFDDA